jgi:hypothetical protein
MTDSCETRQRRGNWFEDLLANRCEFPIGPLNTWSNLAYLVAAAFVIRRPLELADLWMAISLVALGIGSFAYHGWKTLPANRLDLSGMYLVFGSLAVHGFDPANPLTAPLMATTGVLLAVLLAYVVPKVSIEIQMGMLLWFASIPVALAGDWSAIAQVFGLFVLAYAFWQADQRHLTGRYGHAAWHVLTAPAIARLYLAQG